MKIIPTLSLALIIFFVFLMFKIQWLPMPYQKNSIDNHFAMEVLNNYIPTNYKDLIDALQEGKSIPRSYELYYKLAIKFMPQDFSGYYLLALCHQSRGEWKQAQEYYKKSLDLNPGFFWSYYNLGLIFWQNDQPNIAISIWSTGLKIPVQFTLNALISTKLLNDCILNLNLNNDQLAQSLQNGHEILAQWIEQTILPTNAYPILF